MKIICPQCGVSGTLDDAYAGRKIKCPKCSALFLVGDSAKVQPPDEMAVIKAPPSSSPEPQSREAQENMMDAAEAARDESTGTVDEEEVAPPPLPEAKTGDTGGSGGQSVHEKEPRPKPPLRSTESCDGRFNVGDLLRRAWELTLGVKAPIWGGFLVMYGVSAIIVGLITFMVMVIGVYENGIIVNILNIANSALSMIFTAGLMYMGVLRATGRQLIWKDVFAGFPVSGQIIVASFLQMLLVFIGFMLLILPGIYLMVGYAMTFPLMIDRQMTPWQAMEASRKAIHKVWWKAFGLYFLVVLIVAISAIPFGIGLIWTVPMGTVLCGVVYCQLFGEGRSEKG